MDAILSAGGRFVVFEFAISILLLTYGRPSKAWLVRDDAEARRIARRYTIPTMLLGWWQFPDGPEATMRALAINRGGGVDVTADVRAALDDASLDAGVVEIASDESEPLFFMNATRADLKDLMRCLGPVLDRHDAIDAAWCGRRADPALRPQVWPFTIGIEARSPLADGFESEAMTALRTVFRSWVDFEFMIIGDDELSRAMRSEGSEIFRRGDRLTSR